MDIQTIGYILLVATLILFLVLHVRDDRTITALEREVELHSQDADDALNSASFWCALYTIANQANTGMAEALEQYRTTFGDLLDEEQAATPETVAPVLDTDTAIAAMKYCLACCGYKHPPHFVVYPLHAIGMPPA